MHPYRLSCLLGLICCVSAAIPPRLSAQSECCPTVCEAADPPVERYWLGAEFLWWIGKGDRLPALVTASPAGTPAEQAGILGVPGTVVLFGDESSNDEWRPGFRGTVGLWLDDCQSCGIETSLFFLDPAGDAFQAGSPAIIARPFFNTQTGQPDGELVAFPGIVNGTVTVSTDSTVWGGTINGLCNLCRDGCRRLDLLAGYRFLRLTDAVTISEDLRASEPAAAFQVQDHFRTANEFHGGQVGLAGEVGRGRFFVAGNLAIAFGNVQQIIEIDGRTRVTLDGLGATALPGGFLALSSNSGRTTRNDFAVLPALGLRAGMQATAGLRLFVGYDFLYLSHVTRPGDIIDLAVNPALLPPPQPTQGPMRPSLLDQHTDYWLQGVSVGAELRF